MADDTTQWLVVDNPVEQGAELVADLLAQVDAERDARFAVSGGSALATLRDARLRLPKHVWRHTRLTWCDERAVPFDNLASNRGQAYREGALSLADPPSLELPLFVDGEEPTEAEARVTQALTDFFDDGLDVVLLGMGEDGHVASLFPKHHALERTVPVTWLGDSPKPPATRVTLSRALLAAAKHRVLVAWGPNKRVALERLWRRDADLPAAQLGRLFVVTDQEVRQ